MTDTTQHPAIVPDELVKAAKELAIAQDELDLCIAFGEARETESERVGKAWVKFRLALAPSLPRRTEVDIRADERERLAKFLDDTAGKIHHDAINRPHRSAQVTGHCRSAAFQDAADMLRSQGGEDE
jgi:hypothetical protein